MPASLSIDSPLDDAFDAEAVLRSLQDGYCILSGDWRVLFSNRAFAQLTGGTAELAEGSDYWSADVPPDVLLADALKATMTDGVPRSWRAVTSGADLTTGLVDVQLQRVREGLRIHLRRPSLAEQSLADRNEENEALREVARALAAEFELDATLRRICEMTRTQCGGSAAAVARLSGSVLEIVATSGLPDFPLGACFDVAGSATERVVRTRAPVRTADYASEYVRYAPLLREKGIGPGLAAPLVTHDRVVGVLMVGRPIGGEPFSVREERRIRDIADFAALALWKAQLMAEVQAANRVKSEFMATMSHELRTPLTALAGYEELLVDRVLGPLTEQQIAAIERMRSSTELLGAIVDELLTFSHMEAGHVESNPQPTTAAEIVNAATAVIEPLARGKRLALSSAVPDREIGLVTDVDLVRRILVNLGTNAVKFTDRGFVQLAVSADDKAVHFRVKDSGIGIAPEDVPRLFQRFTQLESGLTRRFGGTGLGLFISQGLAVLLGGRIEVESAPGLGSTFELVLPRAS